MDRATVKQRLITAFGMSGALRADAVEALVDACRACDYPKNQMLLRQSEAAAHVSAILSGAVVLWKRGSGGRDEVIGFRFAGDLLTAANQQRNVSDARAIADCTLASVDRRAFDDLCARYPELRHALYARVQNEFAAAQDHLVMLGVLSAQERLAAGLLQLERQQRARKPGAVWLPMRRTDLASYLGLALPTLSRTFAELCRRGAIAPRGLSEVAIADRRQLGDLAGTSEPA
jgi:CRP/FNR family transcriptional regulator